MWLSVWSGLMVWASIKETDDNNSTTSIKDIFGKKHIYRQILINNDNWCIIHERYEFVKRSHDRDAKGTLEPSIIAFFRIYLLY